ncbi:hypothetical protein VOI54_03025 [Tamlana sp. 2201CG12-4]|uniref:hypothetical protein n=1 Tax=Tamlana sp. 2201CG12-4 TaxID=3112582 RepID=UPI002DBCBC6A|nr:hypothetical protein [Tamlana sp. 2201CG12-4]MEC3905983.1 hypothetical protein [Tamlana sp. 2201CG12-4]
MGTVSDEIKEVIDDSIKRLKDFGNDKDVKEIGDRGALSNYFSLVTENIRENNKKLSRNSFWMILSILLYLLIFIKSEAITEIKLLFTTVTDHNFLLNVIPVFFSFLYFKNIALWNHNMNLHQVFDKLSSELYGLGYKTDSTHIIKPFSMIQHISYYQLSNKKVKSFIKAPTTLVLIIFSIFPIIFIFFSIYQIAINNESKVIPIICVVLIIINVYSAVVQLFNPYKNN